MKRLMILLTLTTVMFAGSTLYLWRGRADESHSGQPAPAAQPRPAETPKRAAQPEPASVAASATPPSPATPATPRKVTSANSQLSPSAREFQQRLADPVQRAQMLDESRVMLREKNPGLDRFLGMRPDEYDRLITLLAQQATAYQEAMLKCHDDRNCGIDFAAEQETQQRELEALLGAGRYQKYGQYQKTLPERTSVTSLRGRLADADRMDDSEAETLIAALADERLRIADEFASSGQVLSMTLGDFPLEYSTDTTYDQYMEKVSGYADRMRRRAAAVMTPAQLAVYDQMLAEKMVIVAAMIRSVVAPPSPKTP